MDIIQPIACTLNLLKNLYNDNKIKHISILDYLLRLEKFFICDKHNFICAIIYIDKYIKENNTYINKYDIYKLFLIFLTISVKFWDDGYYKNDYYCRIGGIHIKEFNELETELLFNIGFELNISDSVFKEYEEGINNHINICTMCNKKKSKQLPSHRIRFLASEKQKQHIKERKCNSKHFVSFE